MIIAQYLNLNYGNKNYKGVNCFVLENSDKTQTFLLLNKEDRKIYSNIPRLLGIPIAGDETDLIYTLRYLDEKKIQVKKIHEIFDLLHQKYKD